ncbi:hypothetical protein [Azospirillum sp. sgz302134]
MTHRQMSNTELVEALAVLNRPRTYFDRLCAEIEDSGESFDNAETLTRTTVEFFLLPARMAVTPITALFRR